MKWRGGAFKIELIKIAVASFAIHRSARCVYFWSICRAGVKRATQTLSLYSPWNYRGDDGSAALFCALATRPLIIYSPPLPSAHAIIATRMFVHLFSTTPALFVKESCMQRGTHTQNPRKFSHSSVNLQKKRKRKKSNKTDFFCWHF